MKYIARSTIFLISGVFLGAISWGVVSLVSNRFEPFDSGLGLFTGQFILSALAFGIGYQFGVREILIFVFGAYVGMNSYAYLFGSTDQKAWIFLGLVATLSLIVVPIIFGLCGRLLNFRVLKSRREV